MWRTIGFIFWALGPIGFTQVWSVGAIGGCNFAGARHTYLSSTRTTKQPIVGAALRYDPGIYDYQFELRYIRKGADTYPDSGLGHQSWRFGYLELATMVRVEMQFGRWRPYGMAGLTGDVLLSATVKDHETGTRSDLLRKTPNWELGTVLGIGLAAAVSEALSVSLDYRFAFGLNDIDPYPSEWYSKDRQITLGLWRNGLFSSAN